MAGERPPANRAPPLIGYEFCSQTRVRFLYAISRSKHVMIAGVDAANAASLSLHARLGFEKGAEFREVGRKFNRWLNLVFLQRFLGPPGSPRP